MKNEIPDSSIQVEQFASGQIWQLADSRVQIGLVGKRLVHYKLYKGTANTSPVFLSGKGALATFLQEYRAVLLQMPVALTPSAARRRSPIRAKRPARTSPKTASKAG